MELAKFESNETTCELTDAELDAVNGGGFVYIAARLAESFVEGVAAKVDAWLS